MDSALFEQRKKRASGLGRSRGGLSSKIHLAVNAVGRFCFCRLLAGPGQESDYKYGPALLKGYRPLFGKADKGYDSDLIVGLLWAEGKGEAVIAPKSNRKVKREYDVEKYKGRRCGRAGDQQAEALPQGGYPL